MENLPFYNCDDSYSFYRTNETNSYCSNFTISQPFPTVLNILALNHTIPEEIKHTKTERQETAHEITCSKIEICIYSMYCRE